MSGRYNQASYLVLAASAANPIGPAAAPNQLDGTLAQSANFGTVPVFVKDEDLWAIQFATAGTSTLVGTFVVQGSCERGNTEQTGAPDVTLTDWTTIAVVNKNTGAAASNTPLNVASGANSIIVCDPTCVYRWLRLLFTFTSGAGNPRVTHHQKGWA